MHAYSLDLIVSSAAAEDWTDLPPFSSSHQPFSEELERSTEKKKEISREQMFNSFPTGHVKVAMLQPCQQCLCSMHDVMFYLSPMVPT